MRHRRPAARPASDTGRLEGRTIASFGRHLLVEDDDGQQVKCVPRGRRLRVVCGDRVLWVPGEQDSPGIVEQILPRQTTLTRPDKRGRSEAIAANIDQLLVVCAPKPAFDPFLIDRYLVAAELMGVDAAVLCNKQDLDELADAQGMLEVCAEYQQAGYPVLWLSAKQSSGLAEVAVLASGMTNILTGQSGVGKSSIINALLPEAEVTVGRLSAGSGEGRHTTTASVLHHLPGGGDIIDSPGVRDYAPHLARDQDLSIGFLEFREPTLDCHFSNCQHLEEPRCAVKAAVASGDISKRRYRSYVLLKRRQESLNADPDSSGNG